SYIRTNDRHAASPGAHARRAVSPYPLVATGVLYTHLTVATLLAQTGGRNEAAGASGVTWSQGDLQSTLSGQTIVLATKPEDFLPRRVYNNESSCHQVRLASGHWRDGRSCGIGCSRDRMHCGERSTGLTVPDCF